MSDDREPQPSDGPDFHADHAYWAVRRVSPVTREDALDMVTSGVLGGWNEHHCIENQGCIVCAGTRAVNVLYPLLSVSLPSPVTREALADAIEAAGTDWNYRLSENLPTRPLADEVADAVFDLLSVSPPAEVTDEMVERGARKISKCLEFRPDLCDGCARRLAESRAVLEAAPSDTDRLSMEVIEEYRRIATWLESKAAVTGPVGDTMHGLAAEAMTRLIDREYAAHKIPAYAMLDVWQALYGTSHPEFDEFYAKHGYAETWARLLAAVCTSQPVQVEVTEELLDSITNHTCVVESDPKYQEVASCQCGWSEDLDNLDPDSDPEANWREHFRTALTAALGGGDHE